MQQDLFPDCGFVDQGELAAKAPTLNMERAVFGVGDAEDVDLCPGGCAERTPAGMLAVSPTSTWWTEQASNLRPLALQTSALPNLSYPSNRGAGGGSRTRVSAMATPRVTLLLRPRKLGERGGIRTHSRLLKRQEL